MHDGVNFLQFNFIWSKGSRSNLPTNKILSEKHVDEGTVAKITMYYYHCSTFSGFELFDKQDKCLLSAISHRGNQPPREILLAEGERILGVKSRLCYPVGKSSHKTNGAYHYDLQFIIGKFE